VSRQKLPVSILEPECLPVSSPIAYGTAASVAHLGCASDCHARNRADPDCDLHRSETPQAVLSDVISNFLLNRSKCPEPELQLIGHPYTREIFVARTVSEPAAHLQQRVILACRPQKIADHEAFKRQATGEDRTTDDDVGL